MGFLWGIRLLKSVQRAYISSRLWCIWFMNWPGCLRCYRTPSKYQDRFHGNRNHYGRIQTDAWWCCYRNNDVRTWPVNHTPNPSLFLLLLKALIVLKTYGKQLSTDCFNILKSVTISVVYAITSFKKKEWCLRKWSLNSNPYSSTLGLSN